jgi:hypothetical protein
MHHLARSLAAAALAVTLLACGKDDGSGPPRAGYLASLPIQTVGGTVDFGLVSPCGGSVSRTVRVRNQSKETVGIRAYSSNCACLSAEFLGDRTLKPGDEREVKLSVHPSGHGHRSVRVEFGGDGGFLGSIRVDYSLNSGVATAPASSSGSVVEAPQPSASRSPSTASVASSRRAAAAPPHAGAGAGDATTATTVFDGLGSCGLGIKKERIVW